MESTQIGQTHPFQVMTSTSLALMKGLPGIDSAELETRLKDLPMPEPGAKNGISVKEAVEVTQVSLICYITCYITYYIT